MMSGCSTVGYYAQAVQGHFQVMGKAQPIDELLKQPDLDPKLKKQLILSKKIRTFAVNQLHLPDNDSYQHYADLGRKYVTWVVIATPEFSMEPKRWCFPVVGCLSYRGYFDENDAIAMADKLRQQQLDVDIAGSQAYSTLGWFDDPVLNTLLSRSEPLLAEVIFHELAHQKLYIKDDTAFNEAFAVAVARFGVEAWLKQSGKQGTISKYNQRHRRDKAIKHLLLNTRSNLKVLYSREIDAQSMRHEKQRAFNAMKNDYTKLKASWNGYKGYDNWMNQDFNNAHLALVATYHQLVPSFTALIKQCNGDIQRFYRHIESYKSLNQVQRREKLQQSRCL